VREKLQQTPGDLGARLRALRDRYPSLAVTTEIIHHTDRLITFRAAVQIDAVIRAQGHAAQRAEPTGAFVTAAETLAVEQALLLGGFDPLAEAMPLGTVQVAEMPVPQQASPTADRAPEDGVSPIATTASAEDEAAKPPTAAAQVSPPVPTMGATTEAGSVEGGVGVTEPEAPPPAPRPTRDRRAERARAKARATSAAITEEAGSADDDPPVPADAAPGPANTATATEASEIAESQPTTDTAVATLAADGADGTDGTDDVVSTPSVAASLDKDDRAIETAMPTPAPPTPPAAPRRSRTQSAAAVPSTTPIPDAPATREALREAWRIGRPIPAWWPQNRPLITQPIGKTRVGRLRALALNEEISPALLDTYSTLLFGVAVAALDQTQSMILEERLNPAYPSPLEELRVRRIIHPLAVSDEMPIPEDRPFLIRWSAVSPVEAAPEPVAPPTLTWRERGKKGSGRRRS